ncbi:SIS domain-containing protein [Thermococcus gammatolerans]|nr:SIS domain-containing protein [Thermococcus gammatolerans]
MEMIEKYYSAVLEILERIKREEKENIERAAGLLKETLKSGGIVHVVGAGHSAMLGEELFYRAGGLAPVNPILDTDINVSHGAEKSTAMEDVKGYAEVLLRTAGVREGDIVIVVSTSGVNQFPVEAAVFARELGAKTVGITSVNYSRTLQPRNTYGKRLFEVVDVPIDNKVPRGDAVLEVEGFPMKVAPVSTIANCFIANSMVALAVQELVREGVTPPVWLSAHLPEAKEHNSKLFEKYRGRIKLL